MGKARTAEQWRIGVRIPLSTVTTHRSSIRSTYETFSAKSASSWTHSSGGFSGLEKHKQVI